MGCPAPTPLPQAATRHPGLGQKGHRNRAQKQRSQPEPTLLLQGGQSLLHGARLLPDVPCRSRRTMVSALQKDTAESRGQPGSGVSGESLPLQAGSLSHPAAQAPSALVAGLLPLI